MLKSRKAMFVLIVSSIAFLIASIFFFSNIGYTRAGKDLYFGQSSRDIFYTYYEAENMLMYIDYAAKYSLDYALESPENLEMRFKHRFNQYLKEFEKLYKIDLELKSYTFSFSKDGVIGNCKKSIPIINEKKGINYTFKPNFEIKKEISNENLNQKKEIKDTIDLI